ncbi:prion-inhibition and propagation-domain-containing protein [Truncatella angustata]|uniref:Prion-inhibition and propagation-domain-containing protein n=1 Tax=Truncatella angustata TaxID=152316 RepID=A0A9P8UKW8_9PEZI|nr:prion-inhibition and propagation-domain-containing protein [Truncatella angustata]KAH6653865.1 prion-inhibition and propagation-domain-containing protein [Truncatella angustata]
MDPVSAAGLAIGVASIGLQVYTGCVQVGIQLLITAKNFPEEYKYLNLRLRMEQQRLFAWSETSGLADLGGKGQQKILETNTFTLHRTTVLDLLVQVQCLFKEFQDDQKRYQRLQSVTGPDESLDNPEQDALDANVPLPQRRRDFIKKAMLQIKEKSAEGALRLRWATFDKEGFERLLSKFAVLNDNMTDILDAQLQVEIHHTVQDTNRGMLQLHHKIADLSRLVMALNLKLDSSTPQIQPPLSSSQREARAKDASGLEQLSQLAKFKAFNESIESNTFASPDEKAASHLELGNLGEQRNLKLNAQMIEIKLNSALDGSQRCEAVLKYANDTRKEVWIEWKEYDPHMPNSVMPPKQLILGRIQKLAALLHHRPKPEAFRTPHCLGFFDQADCKDEDSDDDISNLRLGLVFERPEEDQIHKEMPPVSLRELLERDPKTYRRPSLTDRRSLALAVSNCVLSLHLANWLHKSLRSDNIIFFRTSKGHLDYSKPYISGFDFSRPARKDEMTEIAGDDVMHNLYRHPLVQSTNTDERPRFKKSFDIYSIGVLLVEIAHWATVEEILGINLKVARGRPSTIARVRDKLLTDEMREELSGYMGKIYEKAARRCIAGGKWLNLLDTDDETNDQVANTLSLAFYENVVKELESIVV